MKPTNLWKRIPFARICLPFILGISLQFILETWTNYVYVAICILLVLVSLIQFTFSTYQKYRVRVLTGSFIVLQLVLFGFAYAHLSVVHKMFQLGLEQEHNYRIRLVQEPVATSKYWKCMAQVIATFNDSTVSEKQTSVLLYLEKSDALPVYGDVIDIRAKMVEVPPPRNPGEFNYKRYLHFKGVDYQSFVSAQDWRRTGQSTANELFKMAYALNRKCGEIIDSHIANAEHRGILKALLLGNKSELSTNVKQGFSHTGTMHVLAVSGLHVGSILLLINGLLTWVRLPKRHLLRLVLTVFGLWFFALLTGFSASVSRAALMFSVLVVGRYLKRNQNTYNTLAFAAFLLLVLNPLRLMDVGFQFSFIAVFGIVYLSDYFRNWFNTSSWLLDKVYRLLAVSIAAQLVTFPFALFYFKQVPVLFFVSNLLVIPCITVVLYFTIALLAVFWIAPLAWLFSYLITAYLWFVQYMVRWIEKIPYAYIENWHISLAETGVLLGALLFFMIYVGRRKWSWILSSGVMVLVFLGVQIHLKHHVVASSELTFLDQGRKSTLLVRRGNAQVMVPFDSMDETAWDYTIKPYLIQTGMDGKLTNKVCLQGDLVPKATTMQVAGWTVFRFDNASSSSLTKVYTQNKQCIVYVQELAGINWKTLLPTKGTIYLDSRINKGLRDAFRKWCNEKDFSGQLIEGFCSKLHT